MLVSLILNSNVELEEIIEDLDFLTEDERQFIYGLYENNEIV